MKRKDCELEYKLEKEKIIIFGKDDFCSKHIFECGQFFAYNKNGKDYEIFAGDKKAVVKEQDFGFEIVTKDTKFFEAFLDLGTDYSDLKKKLSKYEILKEPIKFGYGIRILKQSVFETLISFILSANNNIKRFTKTLFQIREKFGKKMQDYFAFPTHKELLRATEKDFADFGAGYRAKYLYQVLRQVDENVLEHWKGLPTKELRKQLIGLAGVGPKVADCVVLFGYGRGDVFPVDTWINQMYNKFYGENGESREKIREILTEQFQELSGYAQQYLFYFMRSNEGLIANSNSNKV